MNYSEEACKTEQFKKEYADGIESLIRKREKAAEAVRESRDILSNQDKYRAELCKMLGFPLTEKRESGAPHVKLKKLSEENGYTVYRMHFTVLDTVTVTGLFFKQDGEGSKPLVICQHGGEGTPELISGVYGSTTNYNDMLERVRKLGVHVFAPQLLLWSDKYNVPYDRKAVDARLKRVGSSITAVEIYAIERIIDYFEGKPYVKNFGMVGMSYGGFYTLFTSAVDTRIKAAVSCSFFNKRDAVTWSDWTWQNSAEKFDDAEVACLIYPRSLCIEIGNKDELFDYREGIDAFEKLKKRCEKCGTNWIELIVFDGTHEFCRDDAPLEKLAKILFGE